MIPSKTKLLDLLKHNDVTFFIPPYQRNYSWTELQCQTFLSDLEKTYLDNKSGKNIDHYFGTITLLQDKGSGFGPTRFTLIDGQQRITTTLLFLIALRDVLDDAHDKMMINGKYLTNGVSLNEDDKNKIKLKQAENDKTIYTKIVLKEDIEKDESETLIYKNYKAFKNALLYYKLRGYNLIEFLFNSLGRFSIVTIELEPDTNDGEDPVAIFESMNSTGKQLTLSDLVRVFILGPLDEETMVRNYNKQWLHIENLLHDKIPDFIRDYMQMESGKHLPKATENNSKYLFKRFKEEYINENREVLLSKLEEAAICYSYLASIKNTEEFEIDHRIKELNQLGVITAYSFLLKLFLLWKNDVLTKEDLLMFLNTVKIYYLRRRLVKESAAEQQFFTKIASEINKIVGLSTSEKKNWLFEQMATQDYRMRLPNDIEIADRLETMNFYNFKHNRFYLCAIENLITKGNVDLKDKNLEIEHIMPQTLTEDWKQMLGDGYERIYNTNLNVIGNLTLIRHNSELGNRSFSQKRDIYINKAGIQIAKTKIIDNDVWNEDAIKERTRWLTFIIVNELAPIPEKMRLSNNYVQQNKAMLFDPEGWTQDELFN